MPYIGTPWQTTSPLKQAISFGFVASTICVAFVSPAYAQDKPNASAINQADAKTAPLGQPAPSAQPASSSAELKKEVSNSSLGVVKGQATGVSGQDKIVNAAVSLAKAGEERSRYVTRTDADGNFIFNNIAPGHWIVTVSAKGLLSETSDVILVAGETKDLKMTLEDLESTDIIRVTGKRSLIHPESIGSTTNIDHRDIYEYNSGNDLRELVTSTPGVIADSYGNIITRGEHNAINYQLDGVTLPEAAGVLQESDPVSPRSLQSMQVDIGGYDASDGGGPLGAISRMKSLPVLEKPHFVVGQQIGGPLAGSIYYDLGGAFSQDPDSKLNKLRLESSGEFRGTTMGIAPPVKSYAGNNRADINSLTKLEYSPTDHDKFGVTVGINETFLQVPTSKLEKAYGVKENQQDQQNYIIASYKHQFTHFFDELNLHVINAFYSQKFHSSNAFDPAPDINGGQPLVSQNAVAKRYNFILSAQGDITKTVHKTNHFKAGFYSELRPAKTSFNEIMYNLGANPTVPIGQIISPFTLTPNGPSFQGPIGNDKSFRYVQSVYLQDKWKPETGFLKRLTLDAGVRFDMQHSVFGNSLMLAQAIMNTPGVSEPFDLGPYKTQRITNAQASGRFGSAFVINPTTVFRTSFDQLWMPTPADYFLVPYVVNAGNFGGYFESTPKPLQPTRGFLTDASIEHQIGPRFAMRTNVFYKKLKDFGDSGVIGNLPIYNRLTNDGQNAYGVESRFDLKGSRDGYGLNAFMSDTVQWAFLTGTHGASGGFWDFPPQPLPRYPDHDRRFSNVLGIGYRGRKNWWFLTDLQLMTGVQDERDPLIYGPHPTRTPFLTMWNTSAGYQFPAAWHKRHHTMPDSFDVRVENMLNERLPLNLGSPFQGTRYMLPLRVLAGFSWSIGRDTSKLTSKPTTNNSI